MNSYPAVIIDEQKKGGIAELSSICLETSFQEAARKSKISA
jgi:hypothetical protein